MQENTQASQQSPKSSPNMGIIIAIVAVVGVLGFLVMNGTKKDTVTPPTETTPTSAATTMATDTPVAMTADDGVKIINVDAGAFYYKPAEIKLKVGEKVKIVMTSKDMMHDFIIDELGVKLPITKSGETNTVEFTATKAGTFEYYCSVGQHRAQGQIGKLIVE